MEAKKIRLAPKSKSSGHATACIVATDWHLAETIESEAVNGLNEFNLEIADQRLSRLWNRACFLIDFASKLSKIEEVAILYLGDMISGTIHQDLEQTNEIGASDAIMLAQDYMATGIDCIRKETKLPVRVFCNSGNHGRFSHDRYIKAENDHSLEAIAYANLARAYKNDNAVKFQIARGYFNLCNIQNRIVRAHHGHAVRYMAGIGGPAIPLRKKIAAWNVAQDQAHTDVLGHLHMRLSDPRFEMVGCLCGYSEFGQRIGVAYEPPTQGYFVIDRTWGKVLSMPIHLEEKPTRPEAY